MDIESLARKSARGLGLMAAPTAGEGALRLDGNTNLLGPNPAIRRVLEREAGRDLAPYPAPMHDELRAALAVHCGLDTGEILVGAGADELIDVAVRAFANPGDPVAVAVPTFELYAFCARVEQARLIEVPLNPGFALDADALLRAEAKLTFVASPNNPTGNAHAAPALERLIRGAPGIVVVDEAYAEYCGQDFLKRVREFPNLVVLRTFSKAHGLAGIRVGYAAARREVIERLARVKLPFTIGALSERIALEALADPDHVRKSRERVAGEKPWLAERLSSLGLHPYPTDANFMLVRVGPRIETLVKHLTGRGIVVRSVGPGRGLDGCFRTTIGLREHNERLVGAIGEFIR
ncbi:MAG TPA: histidinol-phosphate transaminase [Planctomycetota bacterium]|nr:histidinol-phosphate transaminase [Planctomycetota bacterium]